MYKDKDEINGVSTEREECERPLYTTIFLISGFQQQGDIAICLSD